MRCCRKKEVRVGISGYLLEQEDRVLSPVFVTRGQFLDQLGHVEAEDLGVSIGLREAVIGTTVAANTRDERNAGRDWFVALYGKLDWSPVLPGEVRLIYPALVDVVDAFSLLQQSEHADGVLLPLNEASLRVRLDCISLILLVLEPEVILHDLRHDLRRLRLPDRRLLEVGRRLAGSTRVS